jgi:hypothetical protein
MRLSLTLILAVLCTSIQAQHTFSVKGTNTYLDDTQVQIIGLRCSNSLVTDEAASDLINHLDQFKSYGINTISVFFMGSRFGDVQGYNQDATLNQDYAERMARIIKACDTRNMMVLVGCLYWGNSRGKWVHWSQTDANEAIYNTVRWLSVNKFKNTFVDPDNEGMANKFAGFDIEAMINSGKRADSTVVIGFNAKGEPPSSADITLHFSEKVPGKPYIESEGTVTDYWGAYSKEKGLYNYINIGVYTPGKKEEQIRNTLELLDQGHGYMMASTWLQCIPPNHNPGGEGTHVDPGIEWWLRFIKNITRENHSH